VTFQPRTERRCCYIPAVDEPSTQGLLVAYFAARGLSVVTTEWLVREDQVEWENPDDPTGRRLIGEALATGEIAVGEFHVWGPDAPDARN